jgi:hypothetical protein
MADTTDKREPTSPVPGSPTRSPSAPPAPSAPRRPYAAPQLRYLGKVAELTFSGPGSQPDGGGKTGNKKFG